MAVLDHLGITIEDLPRSTIQFGAVFEALGYTRFDASGSVSWQLGDEPELILLPAREPGTGPHRHGRIGWQHLAFAVGSRDEVDRMHRVALDAGWTAVREPKEYPRFTDRYYASFVEDDNGIRLEFMHNPPQHPGESESRSVSTSFAPTEVAPDGLVFTEAGRESGYRHPPSFIDRPASITCP